MFRHHGVRAGGHIEIGRAVHDEAAKEVRLAAAGLGHVFMNRPGRLIHLSGPVAYLKASPHGSAALVYYLDAQVGRERRSGQGGSQSVTDELQFFLYPFARRYSTSGPGRSV